MPAQIAILDDDHVIRLTRYAISGPGEITEAWAREFFMPEDVDPARVLALGNGLHEADGVSLIPMSAKLDLRKGSDADHADLPPRQHRRGADGRQSRSSS